MTTMLEPLWTPAAVTVWVCVWEAPVFSLPPIIEGVRPPWQTVDPTTLDVPFQPTQPCSVGVFWMVKTTFEVPIPAPLPLAIPSNTKDACAGLTVNPARMNMAKPKLHLKRFSDFTGLALSDSFHLQIVVQPSFYITIHH